MVRFRELKKGKSGILLNLDLILLLRRRLAHWFFFQAWFRSFRMIGKSCNFVSFLSSANELDRNLRICPNGSVQRFSGQYSFSQLSAVLRRRHKVIVFCIEVIVKVPKPLSDVTVKCDRLGSIIDQEGRIVSLLSQIESSKVQTTLLSASFFEYN
jgi:hypothetical protein